MQKKKYLTLVFKYIQDDKDEARSMGVTKFLNKITTSMKSYQESRNSYDPYFDFYGVYVDEEDVPIEDQNELNENLKSKLK